MKTILVSASLDADRTPRIKTNMRILVVDDSRAMRMLIRRALRHAGYGDAEIDEASSGKEALEVLAANVPDLVLTDWNMPEMSGIELVEHLTEHSPQTVVGMVTSQGTAHAREQAQEAGAAFLLTKPLTASQLANVLDEVLV